jgi:hypothetical protein
LFGLILCGVVGCTGDPAVARITDTLNAAGNLTNKYNEVKDSVKKAIDAGAKSGKNITGKDENIANAIARAKEIRTVALDLQVIREHTERIAGQTSPETKKELAARQGGRLQERLLALLEAERDLRTTLTEAESRADKQGKDELALLRKTIKEGNDAFEALNRQR